MPEQNNITRIKSVWRFGKKYIPLFIVAEICILISYAVSLILPLNLTRLTDKVLYNGYHELLFDVIKSYILLFAVAAISNLIYAFVWQTLNNHYIVDIKNAVFQKTIFAKASFLSNMNSGDIMSRIDWDSEQFIYVVQRNLFHFVNSFLLCALIIYTVAKINLTVAVLLITAAVFPIIFTRLCSRFTEKYTKQTRQITGIFTGRLFEILKGFREIRLACAGLWAKAQVMEPLKKLVMLGNRVRRVDFFVGKGIYLINLSASLVIYTFSVFLIMDGKLTIGLFLAIIQYIALLHKKFNWMLRIYLDWFVRKVSIDRVNEILETQSESDTGEEIFEIESIEFQNVSFSYVCDKPVLEDVSFKINKGERIAIVGTSGVGKTTLIGLLIGFYTPSSGEIFVNNIPVRQIKISCLRKAIGMVSQDILLFDETIRYNLQLGASYTDSEMWSALQAVELKQAVEKLPTGLDTKISAATGNLSGGEKQRLMLARLLLKKTEFMILDEATSALDVETESNIARQFTAFSKKATVLIVSHRLAAVKHCDRTIVLHERSVDAIGAHHELLKSSRVYSALFGGASL